MLGIKRLGPVLLGQFRGLVQHRLERASHGVLVGFRGLQIGDGEALLVGGDLLPERGDIAGFHFPGEFLHLLLVFGGLLPGGFQLGLVLLEFGLDFLEAGGSLGCPVLELVGVSRKLIEDILHRGRFLNLRGVVGGVREYLKGQKEVEALANRLAEYESVEPKISQGSPGTGGAKSSTTLAPGQTPEDWMKEQFYKLGM